jgi:hypothetical protein
MMMKMDEKTLSKNIGIYQQQMAIASKLGQHETFALLNEYETQTIFALANIGMPKRKKANKPHPEVAQLTNQDKTQDKMMAKLEAEQRVSFLLDNDKMPTVQELAKESYSKLSEMENEYALTYKATESMYVKNRLNIILNAIELKNDNECKEFFNQLIRKQSNSTNNEISIIENQ